MGGQQRGPHLHPPLGRQRAGDAQLLQLSAGIETIAGFDLDGGHPFGQQAVEAGQGGGLQRRLTGRAGGAHGGEDAPAGTGNFLIAGTAQALLKLRRTVAAEDQMGVAIDQPGQQPGAGAVEFLRRRLRQRGQWPHPGDAAVIDRHRRILDHPQLVIGHGGGVAVQPDGIIHSEFSDQG